jgi:hypothetical protein
MTKKNEVKNELKSLLIMEILRKRVDLKSEDILNLLIDILVEVRLEKLTARNGFTGKEQIRREKIEDLLLRVNKQFKEIVEALEKERYDFALVLAKEGVGEFR